MKWITVAMRLALVTSTAGTQTQPEVTVEEIDGWMTELSNWGRWGQIVLGTTVIFCIASAGYRTTKRLGPQ